VILWLLRFHYLLCAALDGYYPPYTISDGYKETVDFFVFFNDVWQRHHPWYIAIFGSSLYLFCVGLLRVYRWFSRSFVSSS